MKSIVWIVVSVFVSAQPVVAKPEVRAMGVHDTTLHIQGIDFDQHCRRCEVIANFDNFRYALQVISWTDTDIEARLIDLGKGSTPTVELVTPGWRTKPVRVKLQERLLPKNRIEQFIGGNSNYDDLLYHSRRYDSSLGGKGEEVFNIPQQLPACGMTAAIFDSAEILLGRLTRFGEAKITQMPGVGCTNCQVKVGYYWEPTGRLDYQLFIYRRVVEGICQIQVR